jgi:hypothetical protein
MHRAARPEQLSSWAVDREQRRSSAPGDLREPRRQDETRRTVDLGHSSDGPSWIDLAEIRVSNTESPFKDFLNRLLQQNLPKVRQKVLRHLAIAAARAGSTKVELLDSASELVHILAETEGFEPSIGLYNPITV